MTKNYMNHQQPDTPIPPPAKLSWSNARRLLIYTTILSFVGACLELFGQLPTKASVNAMIDTYVHPHCEKKEDSTGDNTLEIPPSPAPYGGLSSVVTVRTPDLEQNTPSTEINDKDKFDDEVLDMPDLNTGDDHEYSINNNINFSLPEPANEAHLRYSSIKKEYLSKPSKKKQAEGLNKLYQVMLKSKDPDFIDLFKEYAIEQSAYVHKGRWLKFIDSDVLKVARLYSDKQYQQAHKLISDLRLDYHEGQ